MLSMSRTLSGAPAMPPGAASSAVAGRACTCSSRWVRRSTVSMSRGGVAVAVPGLVFQGAQAPVELAAAFFQAAEALQAFRQQGAFGAALPGQGGQMQARVTDHGRGGIQPGLPVPGGGSSPAAGAGTARARDPGQAAGAGRQRPGPPAPGPRRAGEGSGVWGLFFRQVGTFGDKVRQFDDLVLLGRYGHARLSYRMVDDPVPQRLALHSSSCSKRQTGQKKSRGFPRLAERKKDDGLRMAPWTWRSR